MKWPVVVLGQPRGGTSLVAGILHLLGVDMGICDVTNENQLFIGTSVEEYRHQIERYNNTGQPWGFKNPTLIDQIDQYLPVLHGRFVVVFRDSWSVAKSEKKHINMDVTYALNRSCERVELLRQFVTDNECHVTSYEHLIRRPEREINALAEYLELTPKQAAYDYVGDGYTCVLCFERDCSCF